MTQQTQAYTPTAKILHWLMALIIITAWLIGFYTAHMRGDTPRGGFSLTLHESIASTVIFVAAVRLIYRLTHRYPSHATASPIVTLVVKGVHGLLYLIAMLAAPLTGMYWTSVAGYAVPVLGLFRLPMIISKNEGMYDFAMWAHRSMVWSGGFLIALHVLAALKHHLVDRDNILRDMLPARWKN